MPNPTVTFAFVLATLFGAGYHLIMGGGARRLILFLVAGWLGFILGHIAGVFLGIDLFNIGALRFLSAAVGAIFSLIVAHILTLNRPKNRSSRSRR